MSVQVLTPVRHSFCLNTTPHFKLGACCIIAMRGRKRANILADYEQTTTTLGENELIVRTRLLSPRWKKEIVFSDSVHHQNDEGDRQSTISVRGSSHSI